MYKNGFAIAIKKDGKVALRESKGKVYIPFDTEYSILLKNTTSQRSLVQIKIDGTDVMNGSKLIVKANDSSDLTRFCLDGDLDKGNKFKFVPLAHPEVQDPTAIENGLVEVTLWPELEEHIIIKDISNVESWMPQNVQSYPKSYPRGIGGASANVSSVSCSADSYFKDGGATVEGRASTQTFTNGTFGKQGNPTIVIIRLRPYKEAITVRDTKTVYCSECGNKNRYGSKYCSECGDKLSVCLNRD